MMTRWNNKLHTFAHDDNGAVAILFGLSSVALFVMAGLAIDYGRATNAHAHVVDAVDAASLAAGRAMLDGKLTDGEIAQMTTVYLEQNTKSLGKSVSMDPPSINIDRKNGEVDIQVNAHIAMTLARIGGYAKMDIPVASTAVYKERDVEVGMALDITGSMSEVPSKGGKPKISALKDAFNEFADQIMPTQKDNAQRVRIALAPYSASVNLDNFAGTASANASKDGCVTERKTGTFTDSTGVFDVAADGVKDVDPTEGIPQGSAYECPVTHITPLSDDKDALEAAVAKFQPQGWTAGHLGVQWAWNLVSDSWGGTWGGDSVPDSYAKVQAGKLLKAVILMTDGNFNTAYHGKKSSDQALALCDAMKTKGVVVFAIAFDAPPAAQKTLQTCSSGSKDYYADAANGDELQAAFQKFAGKLSELRITK
jgi:Flp pilus assembly protein TadG